MDYYSTYLLLSGLQTDTWRLWKTRSNWHRLFPGRWRKRKFWHKSKI